MATRILIVDDHKMIREGLSVMFEDVPGTEIAGACGDCATAWLATCEIRPDLVLMDVNLPDGSGIGLTRRIRDEFPVLKVIVLTSSLDRRISVAAIDAGAQGLLLKRDAFAELAEAVFTVMAGGFHLSAEMSTAMAQGLKSSLDATDGRALDALPLREGQVLALVFRGLRNKEIAGELNLNVKTVEAYRSRLMKRFDCASPAELVRHAIRTGLAIP